MLNLELAAIIVLLLVILIWVEGCRRRLASINHQLAILVLYIMPDEDIGKMKARPIKNR